jgi:NAD dependent epimerase/dehydratase family enzyme
LASMLTEALDHSEWSGAYNAVSPEVVSQRQFSRALAAALRRPHFFPAVPAWAIRLWFGKAAEALLASHNITPSRLLELGFEFRFPTLETAFESAVTDA